MLKAGSLSDAGTELRSGSAMKRRFLGWWRFGPRGDGGPRGSGGPAPGPGYRLRARDLGKIHRAASAGDVARVQQLLLLGQSGPDDRDKRHR